MNPQDRAIRRVIIAGLLLAITLLLIYTRIGLIPVPTPAGNATIAQIPAIIGGILEGPLVGLIVSLGFGFASFTNATTPMFKDPLVAVVPRLFIGVVAAYVYIALRRANRTTLNIMLGVLGLMLLFGAREVYLSIPWLGIVAAVVAVAATIGLYVWMRRTELPVISLALTGAIGALTNTVLVLSIATWRQYIPSGAAWGIGVTHGLPEMIVSALVVVGVVTALRYTRLGGRSRLQREAEARNGRS